MHASVQFQMDQTGERDLDQDTGKNLRGLKTNIDRGQGHQDAPGHDRHQIGPQGQIDPDSGIDQDQEYPTKEDLDQDWGRDQGQDNLDQVIDRGQGQDNLEQIIEEDLDPGWDRGHNLEDLDPALNRKVDPDQELNSVQNTDLGHNWGQDI